MMYAHSGLHGVNVAKASSITGSAIAGTAGVAAAGVFGAGAAAVAAAAIPFVGPVILGLTLLAGALFKPDLKKIQASNDANQVEPYLKANLDQYLSGPRTTAAQQQAIQNFNQGWSQLVSQCSDPKLGDAGRRCISDRDRDGRPSWGKNWFELYLDPIANDTPVDSAPAFFADPSSSALAWVIPAGLIAAGVVL